MAGLVGGGDNPGGRQRQIVTEGVASTSRHEGARQRVPAQLTLLFNTM